MSECLQSKLNFQTRKRRDDEATRVDGSVARMLGWSTFSFLVWSLDHEHEVAWPACNELMLTDELIKGPTAC